MGRLIYLSISMETTNDNTFKRLLQVDVSKHIDKKGQFSYLSWPFAVSQLRLCDPNATWEVKRFDGLPFLQTNLGYFVEVIDQDEPPVVGGKVTTLTAREAQPVSVMASSPRRRSRPSRL